MTSSSARWSMLLLLGLGLLLSVNALGNPFMLDDFRAVVDNTDIRSLDGLGARLLSRPSGERFQHNDPSRPVVFLSYALNHAVCGQSPFGYHLVNACLHTVNALLVYFVVAWLLRACLRPGLNAVPLGTALLFLCSPVNMGTQVYVYGRSDVLSTTFLLLALLGFLRARERHAPAWQTGALVAFLLALFSKQSAVVLPLLLVLCDWLWPTAEPPRRRLALHAPYWVLAMAYLAFRQLYLGGLGDLEAKSLGSWKSYAILQPYAILRYLQFLLFPTGLAIDHTVPYRGLADPMVLTAWVLLAVLCASVVFCLRRPGPRRTAFAFAVLWFLVSLLPTSSLLPTIDVLVERRCYLPSVGLYAGLVFVVASSLPRRHFWPALAAPVLLFAIVSLARNSVYASTESVWQDVLDKNPLSSRAYQNLAVEYQRQGRYAEAVRLFQVLLANSYPGKDADLANLGLIYSTEGSGHYDLRRAEQLIEQAIAEKPDYAQHHGNLGTVLQKQGRLAQAERAFRQGIALDPRYLNARINLARLLLEQNRKTEARELVEQARHIDPENLQLRELAAKSE